MKTNDRRFFLKTITLSGLAFSGVSAFAGFYKEEEKVQSKEVKSWDVIVVGAGPGGVAAAIAAARNGARVLLVEQYGFLGGMATSALVHPFMPYTTKDKVLTQGSFSELISKMKAAGAAGDDLRWHGNMMIDSEPMKRILDQMCIDAGVNILFHGSLMGVLMDKQKVKAIRVLHKGGVEDLSADVFIDSTGDGDLAAWAGAPYEIGRKEDHATQPMTLCFRMGNVNFKEIDWDGIQKAYKDAKAKGEIKNPREDVLMFTCMQDDVLHFNTTRIIGKTSLDAWSMTEAEIEGRRQVEEMVVFMKKMKGFENAYLQKTASQIGVRESRRIMGSYILTDEDVVTARHFEDGIAASNYPIDIHNPTGAGTIMKHLKPGEFYTIPYRCLVPLKTENILVASRCISATHEAHASARVMPVVWSLGQAAGTAAALCVKKNIQFSFVDIKELKEQLKNQGAFLG